MPAENLESVFERFYSERKPGEAFGKHSGLGLSICRQIVQAHGGRIWAENRSDRSGARFVVFVAGMIPDAPDAELAHASCVAALRHHGGVAGVLIRGPSGAGKSSLALRMIALGARLVADDCVRLTAREGRLWAHAPERLRGLVEARGLGLMRLQAEPEAPIAYVVDLPPPRESAHYGDARVTHHFERTPKTATITLRKCAIPLLFGENTHMFASAIMCLLRGGVLLDPDATDWLDPSVSG